MLSAVSCISRDFCVAVGSFQAPTGVYPTYGPVKTKTLVESWDGKRWSITPSLGYGKFTSVSCVSPKDCTAVGNDALAESWMGALGRSCQVGWHQVTLRSLWTECLASHRTNAPRLGPWEVRHLWSIGTAPRGPSC